MISSKIKITEEGEVFDRKEIALAIRNSTYNDWSYVNILDTKSQTFLCCTSS